jgi:hypothetical protein
MKHTKILAAALLAMGSVSAFADFDANLELDNTFLNERKNTNMLGANARLGGIEQGNGRVEVNASKKSGTGGFVAGKATIELKRDGSSGVADMWGQIGNDMVAVKLGNFEGADLFPLAQDALVLTADEGGYKAGAFRGRTNNNAFHGALNFNAGNGLGFELGLIETKKLGAKKGVRPVVTYANGPLNVALGFESGSVNGAAATHDNQKSSGFGLTAGYKFGAFKVVGNLASGKTDDTTTPATFGGKAQSFAVTFSGDAGFTVGLVSNSSTSNAPLSEASKSQSIYGAYTMPLFDVKGASMTFAASSATASGSNKSDADTGFKVRLNYGF